ncbi:hypothetical protein O181_053546 [Austropuccinia psidii MF-1]|uniref:Peptidase A1 domain-containing protein n=1 Tax=Austropuccinia psidii MF-1 TaxID=1389203 RepID=A0A9Q3E7P6_9BASI|nr:hypothetical protein [Austropuccinia psidii MF-1]
MNDLSTDLHISLTPEGVCCRIRMFLKSPIPKSPTHRHEENFIKKKLFLAFGIFISLLAKVTAENPTSASSTSIPLFKRFNLQRQGRANPTFVRTFAKRQALALSTKYHNQTNPSHLKFSKKFSRQVVSSSENQKSTVGGATIVLTNEALDTEYYARVEIGTPSQIFNVVLDTGSTDMWVAGAIPSSQEHLRAARSLSAARGRLFPKEDQAPVEFFSSKSSTFQPVRKRFNITYGSGFASGVVGSDTVKQGTYLARSQNFAIADTISSELVTNTISGVMGMAFQSLSAMGASPFWQTVNVSTFAFGMTRFCDVPSGFEAEPGGFVTLGGTDSRLYAGDISYVKVIDEGYWTIRIDAIAINGEIIQGTQGSTAAIDTGTSLIGGPPQVVRAIFSKIPQAVPGSGDYHGYHTYPCASQFNLTFYLGGREYVINPADLNAGEIDESGGDCLGGIFGLEPPLKNSSSSSQKPVPDWILGAAFLKNVYSVFQRGPPATVGFALPSSDYQTLLGGVGDANHQSFSDTNFNASMDTKSSQTCSLRFETTPQVILVFTRLFLIWLATECSKL